MVMILSQNSEIYSVRELEPNYDKVLGHVMACNGLGDLRKLEMLMQTED